MAALQGRHFDMAEDWAKVEAELGKLLAKCKPYSLDGATKLWHAIQTRDKLIEAHEKALEKAVIAGHEAGIVGKSVADFAKDKGFSDAKKLLDADRKALVGELKALDEYCDACDALGKVGDKMNETVLKSLKAAKVSSPAQRKVDKMRLELAAKVKDLFSAHALGFKPEKFLTTFNAQFDKLIDHFLAEALKKAKPAKDAGEMPQPLASSKNKKRIKDMAELDKRIEKLCKDALAAAADKAPQKAMKLLETAQFQLEAMQKIYGEFAKLVSKFKTDIAASKDHDDVKKAGVEIKKLADDAKATCLATRKKIEDKFADEESPEDYLGLAKLFKN
jgi:hypothetical protein